MEFLRKNLDDCRKEIAVICHNCGRDLTSVDLVIATKYASTAQLQELCDMGVKAIGENKIQDAVEKFVSLKNIFSFQKVQKHFLGHLQRNKVKQAVEWFDVIETVDSLRLAQALDQEAQKQGKILRIYIEVNIGDEPQKFGINPIELPDLLSHIVRFSHLRLEGLMTIFPFYEDLELVRPYAKKMKQLFDMSLVEYPALRVLSMGMSHDMSVAIEEGATELRIGRKIIVTKVK